MSTTLTARLMRQLNEPFPRDEIDLEEVKALVAVYEAAERQLAAADAMAQAGHELADALFALGRGEITALGAAPALAAWNDALAAYRAAKEQP